MEKADLLMKQGVREHVFPGGVLLVSKQGNTIFHSAYGKANIYSDLSVDKDTMFDLASLTKPLATTLAVMKLIEKGALILEDPLGRMLPEFKGTPKETITVRQLLDHTSGLPDYRPYYQELMPVSYDRRRTVLKELLVKEKLIHPSGKTTVYSDLGFMILGWIVETVSGLRLNSFVEKSIYSPMGLTNLFFIPINESGTGTDTGNRRFAATETCPWRKRVVEGIVHDDNAFITGGVEGHAGLFGTAGEVNRLLVNLLDALYNESDSGIFDKEILHRFFRIPDNKNRRALGFDIPSRKDSSSGKYFSEHTVGHLGYTGTSFWMDIDRSIIVILLTNRIHPDRGNEKIKTFRPQLHDAVMQQLT
jgi:CubicO group peptidase (beta-lactamase class C family)